MWVLEVSEVVQYEHTNCLVTLNTLQNVQRLLFNLIADNIEEVGLCNIKSLLKYISIILCSQILIDHL